MKVVVPIKSFSELGNYIYDEHKVLLNVTPRHAIASKEGYLIASADYKNQEVYIAGVLSDDPVILKTIDSNPKMEVNGKEYPNPDADMHTLTTVYCCFPQLFEGKPKHEWVKIAKDESAISIKGSARDYGKRTNFAIIYLATAKTIALTNSVKESVAQVWVNMHERTYVKFHTWAKEMAELSTARGWIASDLGRIRYTQEDNAKAAGSSPARSGVNFMIQSPASDMTKYAAVLTDLKYEQLGDKASVIGIVHDELLAEVPGTAVLDIAATLKASQQLKNSNKRKVIDPVWIIDEEAMYYANILKDSMETAQTEFFEKARPGCKRLGKADVQVAPHWSH